MDNSGTDNSDFSDIWNLSEESYGILPPGHQDPGPPAGTYGRQQPDPDSFTAEAALGPWFGPGDNDDRMVRNTDRESAVHLWDAYYSTVTLLAKLRG